MALNGKCSICGSPDSLRHALLECNLVRCVWALEDEDTVEFIMQTDTQNARDWLAEIMQGLKHEELTRVVVRL
jgi:hypothetical protein